MAGTFPGAEVVGPYEEGEAALLRACLAREGQSLANEGEQTEAYEEAMYVENTCM